MKGFVYFQQGWTDIIICLSLIDFYLKNHDHLTVVVRSDAKNFFDFYVRNKKNVTPLYIQTDNGRYYGNINKGDVSEIQYHPNGASGNIMIPHDYNLLCHAEHDKFREDKYRHYWGSNNFKNKSSRHFSEMFYTFYDIPFDEKVYSFSLDRDFDLEDKTYSQFISENTKNYVLYHDDQENHLHGSLHVSTKIDFENILDGYNYVNLNKKSNKFFDYIKVIENAKEIHLVDSIWAGICYQIDAKYGVFKNIPIYLYSKRGHSFMFEYPIKLENWTIL